ncbi:MAG: glycoside hydrolase [Prevotella sp.]|nr:glycoside hydrolase [Prevotella sp.]
MLLLLPGASRAEEYCIDTQRVTSACEGWGVSLCWWAAMCGRDDEGHSDEGSTCRESRQVQLEELIDWLVSPEGLNYSVFRYNIGGGDDPDWTNCSPHHFKNGKGLRAEMEGFKDGPDDDYHWERDSAQRKILLMIKRHRPDAVFEAFSNSAPWWMTTSGCVAGASKATDDNLPRAMYGSFAQYLVDVCRHYKDAYGIEFATLEPFNEPMSSSWFQNGVQEGCHFDINNQIEFVRVLRKALKKSGLATKISASDEVNVAVSLRTLEAYTKAGAARFIGQWNTHTYIGSKEEKARLHRLCEELNVRLWQSETGLAGKGIAGNLALAQRLVDDIRYLRPAVWCDWQYVETTGDQWCMVRADDEWKTCTRVKSYFVHQQFSRFIPAGYHWLDIDDECGLAAVSPDGKTLVYVSVNASKDVRNVKLTVPENAVLTAVYRTSENEDCALVSASAPMFNLMPLSVTTVIFSLE